MQTSRLTCALPSLPASLYFCTGRWGSLRHSMAARDGGDAAAQRLRLAVARTLPEGFELLGARVEHLTATSEDLLSRIITQGLSLPEASPPARPPARPGARRHALLPHPRAPRPCRRPSSPAQGVAERLIWFGAVHTCPVPPVPRPGAALSAEHREELEAVRAQALKAAGKDVSLPPPTWAARTERAYCACGLRGAGEGIAASQSSSRSPPLPIILAFSHACLSFF